MSEWHVSEGPALVCAHCGSDEGLRPHGAAVEGQQIPNEAQCFECGAHFTVVLIDEGGDPFTANLGASTPLKALLKAIDLDLENRDELREILDRSAMPGQSAQCAYCEDDPDHPYPDSAGTCTCASPGCGRGWCPQRDDDAMPDGCEDAGTEDGDDA